MQKQPERLDGFLRRKSVLAVNAVIFLLAAWGFAGEFVRNRETQHEIDRLSKQVADLESKNFEIARLGQKLATTDMLEREARLNLGLQKPGESVIIVQDAEPPLPAPARPPTVQEQAGERVSNAGKWWRYFFKPNQM